jgi:hypothetical protein
VTPKKNSSNTLTEISNLALSEDMVSNQSL